MPAWGGVAALTALCLLAGCAREPLRDEGPAPTASHSGLSRGPDLRRLNVRELLLADPLVRAEVKTAIRDCARGCGLDQTVYADLTGDDVEELRVSIDSGTGRGTMAAYVYGVQSGAVRQLWAYHGADFSVTVENGQLVLNRELFRPGDFDEPPVAEEIIGLHWERGRFVEVSLTGAQPGLVPNTW
ncbi:hypothetical protein SAMN05421504_103142 [Amycolatopsis xylanica]|uniref:Lipoprotein n=1 Tax=Amycolatopsis xylanica TaxID=589385 RepID=A0A1H3CTA5_9PSEU|nr:hypothetical protein [Amycolatopsis xylanica]SDX57326.1 hypothetical protein SAMN05421504_103142 [Amycolatopsis xylanica]